MADALRATAMVPAFGQALRLHLVETGGILRQRQAALLGSAGPVWHDDIGSLPAGPRYVVANEFLDALPVHQMVRTPAGWRERGVALDAAGAFAYVDDLPAPSELVPARDLPVGTLVERRPAAEAIVRDVAAGIAADGGRALFIDYGYADGHGDTLQAVRGHERVSVLDAPGLADLTAHVAFADLARVAELAGAAVWGPIPRAASYRRSASWRGQNGWRQPGRRRDRPWPRPCTA